MNGKKIAAFAIGPVGSAALGFITLPIITWFYSAEDVGRIAMLQVVSSFGVLLFSLGLDQAYVREYHETENKPQLLKAVLLPGLLFLSVALLGCLLVPGLMSKALFAVDSVLISLLVSLYFWAAFVSRFLSLILRMQERGLAFSMSQVLPKLLFLLVIGSFVCFAFGFDLLHLVIAHTLSILAVMLVFSWNTRNEWLASLRQKIDSTKLKAMLRFGTPLILGGVAYWALTAMDRLFLRGLSTFEELGVYSVAASFATAGILLQSIFSTVWAPTVYKWVAEGVNTEKINQVTQYVLLAAVFLFSFAGMFSWVVTYLLPEQYEKVQYLLVACMAYPLFYTLSETTVVGIGITRRTGYAMLASIIAALINLVGNYLLVPTYGASGAAVSTAVSFWVFFFCRTELAYRLWRPGPRIKIYIFTLVCLSLAVSFALFGEGNRLSFILCWLIVSAVSVLAFRSHIQQILMKTFNYARILY